MLYIKDVNCRTLNLSFDNILDNYESVTFNITEDISEILKCKIIENAICNGQDGLFSLNAIVYKDNIIEILGNSSSKIIKSLFEYAVAESFKLSNIYFLKDLKDLYYSDLPGAYKRKIKECQFKTNIVYANDKVTNDFLKKYKDFCSI